MPYNRAPLNGVRISDDERSKLIQIRRETLDDAARMLYGPEGLPVQWRVGWKAHIKRLGRSQDGSLLAAILVTVEGSGVIYTRNVRLTRKKGLPWSLRRGLREG
jgi:hypothetical protein